MPANDVRRRLGDVVLDEDVVLEDGDLRALAALADDHLPVDGLAAGEELGLGQDRRAAAAGVAAVAAALALGLQPGGAGHAADVVVAGGAAVAAGPLGAVVVVGVLAAVLAATAAAAAPATAPAARARAGLSSSSVSDSSPASSDSLSSESGLVLVRRRRRRPPFSSSSPSGGVLAAAATAATAATAAAPAAARGALVAVVVSPRRCPRTRCRSRSPSASASGGPPSRRRRRGGCASGCGGSAAPRRRLVVGAAPALSGPRRPRAPPGTRRAGGCGARGAAGRRSAGATKLTKAGAGAAGCAGAASTESGSADSAGRVARRRGRATTAVGSGELNAVANRGSSAPARVRGRARPPRRRPPALRRSLAVGRSVARRCSPRRRAPPRPGSPPAASRSASAAVSLCGVAGGGRCRCRPRGLASCRAFPGADPGRDWRPRRNAGWAGRAAARGTADSARPAKVCGRPPRDGCRGRGPVLVVPAAGGCWHAVERWSRSSVGAGLRGRVTSGSRGARRRGGPRGSTGQTGACSPWQRVRAARSGPSGSATVPVSSSRPCASRTARGATAGAGRRRQPGRPTRRLVVQRASPAGRPRAVWHNLPSPPADALVTAARASTSRSPFLVRFATVTTSLARNFSTAGAAPRGSRRAAPPARPRCRSGRPASRSPPRPRRTSRTATSGGQRGVQRRPHGLGVAADRRAPISRYSASLAAPVGAAPT